MKTSPPYPMSTTPQTILQASTTETCNFTFSHIPQTKPDALPSVNKQQKSQNSMHQHGYMPSGPSGVVKKKRNSVFTRVQPYESVFKVEYSRVRQWVMEEVPRASKKTSNPAPSRTEPNQILNMQNRCGTQVSTCENSSSGTKRKGRMEITWNDLFN